MPSELTQWGQKQFISIIMGLVSPPDNFWVALAGAQPGQRSDGSMLANLEPPFTAASATYARQEVAAGDAAWGVTDSGYVANLNVVDFGVPDTNWGYMPYYALCDAATDGHIYGYGEFSNPQTLTDAYLVRLPAGALTLKAIAITPSIVA